MPAVTKTRKSNTEVVSPVGAVGENHIIFGITFELNGSVIPISAGDVTKWKEEGAELALPQPIEVGSIQDALDVLEGWLGVEIPKAEDLPEPIKKIVEGITSMVITVYKAEIKIPGTKEEKKAEEEKKEAPKTRYLLEVGGYSEKGIPLIPGTEFLMIKGLVVGATNKELPKPKS